MVEPKRFREADNDDIANMLMLLSQGEEQINRKRVFDCKTCNKQFDSFQALGGHRASHKKPRISNDTQSEKQSSADRNRVHGCSICGVEFAIGQALGGHMRKHWAGNEGFGHHGFVEKKSNGKRVMLFGFDLATLE